MVYRERENDSIFGRWWVCAVSIEKDQFMGMIRDFLDKKWVRVVGILPMVLYSLFVFNLTRNILSTTVFRLPNQVTSGTDLIGMIGYLFFLGIILWPAVAAIFTAYHMKGIYKFLYLPGSIALLLVLSHVPLSLYFNAEYDLNYKVDNPKMITGKWMDNWKQLQLNSDNTYSLTIRNDHYCGENRSRYEGTWKSDGNRLILSSTCNRHQSPWTMSSSDGYVFITYGIPENLDGWAGDLGLMREKDWLDVNK